MRHRYDGVWFTFVTVGDNPPVIEKFVLALHMLFHIAGHQIGQDEHKSRFSGAELVVYGTFIVLSFRL